MAVPPPSPSAHDKAALRRQMRMVRTAHVAGLRAEGWLERATADAASYALPHIASGVIVALYRAFGDELDPAPLARLLTVRGNRLALPHLDTLDGTMRFLVWHPEAPLFEGMFGLEQPHDESEVVAPAVIVAPLIAFDRHGGRLGQGKGYYDRAFAALPHALRIGYGWAVQETDALPHDPWDMPLHAVATETAWIAMPEAAR